MLIHKTAEIATMTTYDNKKTDVVATRGLYCAVALQVIEDAFIPERLCKATTATASSARVIKDKARNYFLSPFSDIKEDRETLFRDLCELPNPCEKIEMIQQFILSGKSWVDVKKELRFFGKEKKHRGQKCTTSNQEV